VQGPINLFPWATVIGVVGDVKHNGLDRGPSPAFYRPHQQHPRGDMTLVVRTQADPMTLANSVRNQVREMDRDLPISNLREYTYFAAKSVAQRRFAMSLLAIFAAIALALALFGIYGVLSYSVSQRTQELAIRQALGAQPRDVLALVVRQGMYLVSVGIIVGLAAAFGATRVMTSMLYEIKPLDLTTFVTVPSLIAGIAALACYLPARRASKANPMVALRNE
jgi:putative ABC transport system permease protein